MAGENYVRPVLSDDPAFTILPIVHDGEMLTIDARDTNGRDYGGRIKVSPRPSGTLALSQ